MQKVLRYLVVEDGLQQEHIALLWDLTEKVCLVSFDLGLASSVMQLDAAATYTWLPGVSNLVGCSSCSIHCHIQKL